MPLDRSRIKKGAFLTSTPIPPGYGKKNGRPELARALQACRV
jgi:hypothetical protein